MDISARRPTDRAGHPDQSAPIPIAVPDAAAPTGVPVVNATLHHIGFVMEISGSESQVTLDASLLTSLDSHSDSSIAMSGQVGSQIKIRVGSSWLLANIRTQKMYERDHETITAQVDFLGEGDEDIVTGKICNFRRGVTRYPVPAAKYMRFPAPTSNKSMPPTRGRMSKSARCFQHRIFAARCMLTPCLASILRCWVQPVRVSRPARP